MISKILYLLAAVTEAVRRWARKREQERAQDERDSLEDDPAKFYRDHFGGVSDDDADKTDKADADRDRKG